MTEHAAGGATKHTPRPRNRGCAGPATGTLQQVSACGATSSPRPPLTNAAKSAKIATLTRSDAVNERSTVKVPVLLWGPFGATEV